jgi:outer membrane immunogenic protein
MHFLQTKATKWGISAPVKLPDSFIGFVHQRRWPHMRARLAAIALSFAMTSASAAADLGKRAPYGPSYYAPVSAFTWTGLYFGVTGGYGFGNARLDNATTTGGTFKTNGANLGSALGYNMQSGSIVYGVETDISVNWVKGTNGAVVPCPSCEASNPWLGTFRGRVGYAPNMTLFYVTGGLAYGGVRVKDTFGGDETHNKAGWTLGGGVEHALNKHWSAKLEYLYVDLGNTGFSGGLNTRFNENIVRAGLNAHF